MAESTTDLHELLLGLAGFVPDEVTTMARGQLAGGDLAGLARTVACGVRERRVALHPDDVRILADVGLDPAELSDVDPDPELPVAYGFWPELAGADGGPDLAAVGLVESTSGVRGLWRTWRVRRDGSRWSRSRRVYVVEVDADADPVAITATVQQGLVVAGEMHPQVEVYVTGADVPPYLRLARAGGELLWARSAAPEIRTARLFDGVDPERGPVFRSDHERIDDEAERRRLIDYLRAGEPLMVSTARLADAVDPGAGDTVPVDFRTDGTWLWSDATTYYLERHQLAPDPELVAHIRARGYQRPELDGVDLHRALAALQAPADEEPLWTFD
jgi:hypothetical protein